MDVEAKLFTRVPNTNFDEATWTLMLWIDAKINDTVDSVESK